MFNLRLLLASVCIGAFSFTGCVSNKKYNASQASLTNAKKKITDLRDELESTKGRLQLMEEANASAADQIDEKDKKLTQSQQEIQEQQEKLAQLQALIDKQKMQTSALKDKMTQALGNFNSDQLTVFTKNGKVYVSLSEKLLFPSGSAEVNADGKMALEQVAKALNENKDINISVEGHTDSIPIKIRFEDNWALSVARSTAIVRLLTNTYLVDPVRITASGRSQWEPIADNATPEGRSRNRRTEIILAPKLDELMQLIDDASGK